MHKFIVIMTLSVLGFLSVTPLPKTNDLQDFMASVGYHESENKPHIVNRFGMMGKYQFSPRTLRHLGFNVTRKEFLASEELQDSAMVLYLRRNKQALQSIIDKFDGKTIKGVRITESGILAGAHLVGAGGVLAFFNPKKYKFATKDGNGTSVALYMEKFADYDLSIIE